MPPRDWKLRVEDMIEAIERIQKYTDQLSYEEFASDSKTVDAVVRNFEVLGEAAGHIPTDIQVAHTAIPWSKMRGMRNLLSHEYFGVSDSILWVTARNDLAPLLPLLKNMLK